MEALIMGQFQLPVSKCINLPASPTSFSPSILLKDMSLLQLNSPCVMDLILFYIFRQISYQLVHLYLILFGIIYLSIGSLIATFKHILPSLKKKKVSLDFLLSDTIQLYSPLYSETSFKKYPLSFLISY